MGGKGEGKGGRGGGVSRGGGRKVEREGVVVMVMMEFLWARFQK